MKVQVYFIKINLEDMRFFHGALLEVNGYYLRIITN